VYGSIGINKQCFDIARRPVALKTIENIATNGNYYKRKCGSRFYAAGGQARYGLLKKFSSGNSALPSGRKYRHPGCRCPAGQSVAGGC
jgi:hypothetical protein